MRSEIVERMRGIYVIVDPEHTNNRNVIEVAEAAFNGGAATVQLRDKISSKRTIVETATEIQKLANDAGSLFIMNDHADIARIVASDGLHVGQKDISVEDSRVVLDDRQIVGTSNALVTEAQESERIGADYLAEQFPKRTLNKHLVLKLHSPVKDSRRHKHNLPPFIGVCICLNT